MRHYRCRNCEALFATESVEDRVLPQTVFCPFCGDDAKAFDSLQGIQGALKSRARAERVASLAA